MMNVAMVELADGSVALIDADDLSLVAEYDWHLPSLTRRRSQHPVGHQRGCTALCDIVFLHRLISQAGPDDIVLHRNLDTLDNRRENLVVVARQSLPTGLPQGQTFNLENVVTTLAH